MNILTILGSLRAKSVNASILRSLEAMAPHNLIFGYFNEISNLPHFNPDNDLENTQPAMSVLHWRNALKTAQAVVICTPEYAAGVPGSLKNALDWIVSSGEFVDKPVAVVGSSPMQAGGYKANASLRATLTIVGARIVGDEPLAIPFIQANLNELGDVNDMETPYLLRNVLDNVINASDQQGSI